MYMFWKVGIHFEKSSNLIKIYTSESHLIPGSLYLKIIRALNEKLLMRV